MTSRVIEAVATHVGWMGLGMVVGGLLLMAADFMKMPLGVLCILCVWGIVAWWDRYPIEKEPPR